MLFALFDKDCDLVGWINPGNHIFNTDMDWVAYLANGHSWSANSGNWLGPVKGLLCQDQDGRPVAWNPKEAVSGSPRPARPARAARAARPARPARPATPARPARPATPAGGWSPHSFYAWLAQ
jgi:hypothetical protein